MTFLLLLDDSAPELAYPSGCRTGSSWREMSQPDRPTTRDDRNAEAQQGERYVEVRCTVVRGKPRPRDEGPR